MKNITEYFRGTFRGSAKADKKFAHGTLSDEDRRARDEYLAHRKKKGTREAPLTPLQRRMRSGGPK